MTDVNSTPNQIDADLKAAKLNDQMSAEQMAADLNSQRSIPAIRTANRTAGSMAQATGSLLSDIGVPALGKPMMDYGQGVVDRNPSDIQTASDLLDKPGTAVQEGLAQAAVQVPATLASSWAGAQGGAALGGLAGPAGAAIGGAIGAGIGAFAPNYIQEAGEMRQNQREVGKEDLTKAYLGAIPAAGLETAGDLIAPGGRFIPKPLGKVLGGLSSKPLEEGAGIGARLAHGAKEAAKGAIIEGPATEYPQTLMEQYFGNKPTDTPEAHDEQIVSAALGAIGGGTIRGGMETVAPTRPDQQNNSAPGVEQTTPGATPVQPQSPTAPIVDSTVPGNPASTAAPIEQPVSDPATLAKGVVLSRQGDLRRFTVERVDPKTGTTILSYEYGKHIKQLPVGKGQIGQFMRAIDPVAMMPSPTVASGPLSRAVLDAAAVSAPISAPAPLPEAPTETAVSPQEAPWSQPEVAPVAEAPAPVAPAPVDVTLSGGKIVDEAPIREVLAKEAQEQGIEPTPEWLDTSVAALPGIVADTGKPGHTVTLPSGQEVTFRNEPEQQVEPTNPEPEISHGEEKQADAEAETEALLNNGPTPVSETDSAGATESPAPTYPSWVPENYRKAYDEARKDSGSADAFVRRMSMAIHGRHGKFNDEQRQELINVFSDDRKGKSKLAEEAKADATELAAQEQPVQHAVGQPENAPNQESSSDSPNGGSSAKVVFVPHDPRLRRTAIRAHLKALGDQLVKGGGVGKVMNAQGDYQGRTPSLNPEWFQEVAKTDGKLSVEAGRKAIDKAVEEKKLGVREKRFVSAAINHIQQHNTHPDSGRLDHLREMRSVFHSLMGWNKMSEDDLVRQTAGMPDEEPPGYWHEEADYSPELDEEARVLADLWQEALQHKSGDDLEELVPLSLSDQEAAQRLWKVINDGRSTGQSEAASEGVAAKTSDTQAAETEGTKSAASPGQTVDLFGGKTDTQQDVHDERIKRDLKRNGGTGPVVSPGMGAGDLFSGASKQVDIADLTKETPDEATLSKAGLKLERKTSRDGRGYWAVSGNIHENKAALDEIGFAPILRMNKKAYRSYFTEDPLKRLAAELRGEKPVVEVAPVEEPEIKKEVPVEPVIAEAKSEETSQAEIEAMKARAKKAYMEADLDPAQYTQFLSMVANKDFKNASNVLEILGAMSEKGNTGSAMATTTTKARGKANLGRLMTMLGSQMYSQNLAEVSIKEMVQNSFDSVKASLNQGKTKQGSIHVIINRAKRLIVVRDTGMGMTVKTIKDAFLTAAGSDKTDLAVGQNSGGFGMAKNAFLLGSDHFWVETVRDGKRSTFDAPGATMYDEDMEIKTEPATKGRIGTTVVVKIPEKVTVDGQEREIWFPYGQSAIEFFQKPLLDSRVEVKFSEEYDYYANPEDFVGAGESDTLQRAEDAAHIVPIGKHQDMDGIRKHTTARFDWGSADIYIGVKRHQDAYSAKQSVLSAGVYQFDAKITESKDSYKRIPYDAMIDYHVTVPTDSPMYPFDLKREGFKENVKADIEGLNQYVRNVATGLSLEKTVETFKSMKALPRVSTEDLESIPVTADDYFVKREKTIPGDGSIPATPYVPPSVTIKDGNVTGKDAKGETVEYVNKDAEKKKKDPSFKPDKEAPKAADFLLDMGIDEDLPVYHNNTTGNFDKGAQLFSELGSLFLEMRDRFYTLKGWGLENKKQDRPFFTGISIDKKYHGVNLVLPFKGIFINPLSTEGKSVPGIVYGLYDTMTHELAHEAVRDHNESFIQTKAKIDQLFAEEGFNLEMTVTMTRVLKRHREIYNQMREEYENSTTTNVAGSLHEGEEAPGVASEVSPSVTGENDSVAAQEQRDAVQGGRHGDGGGPLPESAGRVPGTPSGVEGQVTKQQANEFKSFGKPGGFWLGLATRDMLVDLYQKDLPELKQYQKFSKEWESIRNSSVVEADELIKDWAASMTHEEASAMSDVAYEATLAQFDPDIDVPKNESQQAIKDSWDKLNDQQQFFYMRLRDSYAKRLDEIEQAYLDRILATVSDPIAQTTMMQRIAEDFKAVKRKGPYFPLPRFGDHVVVSKQIGGNGEENIDSREVSYHATEGAANKRAKEMRAKGYVVRMTKKKEYDRDRQQEQAISKIIATARDALDLAEMGAADTKMIDDLADNLRQTLVEALPDMAYRKAFTHRKDVRGFDRDMRRAYAERMYRSANLIAGLRTQYKQQQAIKEMQHRVDSHQSADAMALQDVVNETIKRERALAEYRPSGLASAIQQFGFNMALGFNISSAAVNLLQTPMVAMPYMAARHGLKNTLEEFARAGKLLKNRDLWSADGFQLETYQGLSGDERRALQEMVDSGQLNYSLAHDVINSAYPPGEDFGAVGKAAQGLATFSKWSAVPFHLMETVNREITALAAYRLARRSGLAHSAAVQSASSVVDMTHFDYQSQNRSRAMMGNTARVLMMFKQYSMNMAYIIGRHAYLALRSADPQERAVAAKTIGYMMAATFTASGLLGLPLGFEAATIAGATIGFQKAGKFGALAGGVTALMIANALVDGIEGDDDDLSDMIRRGFADALGKQAGEVVTHGPLRLTGIDLAGRTSLNEMFVRAPQTESEGRDLYQKWTETLLGPAAGFGARFFDASKLMADGEYQRAFESILPNSIRSVAKGVRYATEGATTIKGKQMLNEPLNAGEVFAQMIGITPARLAEAYEGNTAVKNVEIRLNNIRERLINRRVHATGQDAEDVTSEIQAFNSEHPTHVITGRDLAMSVRKRAEATANSQGGLSLSRKHNRLRDMGRFADTE